MPAREIRYDRNIAVDRIAHHVASGIAILSSMTDGEIEDYIVVAARSGAFKRDERDAVMKAIATARESRVAINLRGRVDGASGVAAAVVDGDGRPIAAVNISGPSERVEAGLEHIVDVVATSARLASQALARRLSVPKDTLVGRRPARPSPHRPQDIPR